MPTSNVLLRQEADVIPSLKKCRGPLPETTTILVGNDVSEDANELEPRLGLVKPPTGLFRGNTEESAHGFRGPKRGGGYFHSFY